MKRIMYLLLLGAVLGFFACSDVEVGYLDIKNADYPEDTLHIYNVEEKLVEYKAYQAKYNELAGVIDEQVDEVNDEISQKGEDIDNINYDLEDLLYAMEDASGADKDALQARFDELMVQHEKVMDEIRKLENDRWDLWQKQKEIVKEMGFSSKEELTNAVLKLENTLKYNIPWVTPPLSQILGTEPMRYSIARVKNEKSENAELFQKSLTIMGGGRMYVAFDLKIPAGMYTVSIAIDNEGQHAVLEDAFTFIVDE